MIKKKIKKREQTSLGAHDGRVRGVDLRESEKDGGGAVGEGLRVEGIGDDVVGISVEADDVHETVPIFHSIDIEARQVEELVDVFWDICVKVLGHVQVG